MLLIAGMVLGVLPGCHPGETGTARNEIAQAPIKAAASQAQAPGHAASPDDAPVPVPVPPRGAAATPSAQHAMPMNQAYLEGESQLLNGGELSGDQAQAVLLSSRSFKAALQQFESDASLSPDAQDLTRLYQAAATRALGEDVALASLSCGYTLCMGEVRSRSQGGFRDWVGLFGKDRGAPHYALMTAEYPLGNGQSSGRFVFSIDPTANGISQ
ncbi:hypothetical protein [Stenotrophomonas sp. S41]|uniref:hypothetical protein n=1 Tax=Stenotrophomonas sp. S41 TaxID=2767464 RepID=UPI00190B88DA|nr:hypothetical protein [Stenotrophomonas sp. S41]MBK0013447.1 hypothetical protein [Stenotrophomonas sp. S41]